MKLRNLIRSLPRRAGMTAAVSLLACNLAAAGEADRGVLVLTSTNDPSSNQILVYQLDTAAPALSLVQTLPTGGQGGAGERRHSADGGRLRRGREFRVEQCQRALEGGGLRPGQGTGEARVRLFEARFGGAHPRPAVRGRRQLRGEPCVAVR